MSKLTLEPGAQSLGGMPGVKGVSLESQLFLKRFVALFLFLSGLGIIVLVTLKPLTDHLGLGDKLVLAAWAALAFISTALLMTPLGRRLTRAWSIPYVGAEQNLAKVFLLTAELGVLLLVVRLFEIENTAFYDVLIWFVFGGFLVNQFLPMQLRMPFFLALSLLGFMVVLGVVNGAWVIGLGLVLIGLTRLPLTFNLRVALVVIAGAALVLLRVGVLPVPWSPLVWPILGAIFMFRLIIYLYDLKHSKTPPGWVLTLSYFFVLPNMLFPLFPAIDFTTMRRTYYDGEHYAIYQRGIRWMVRGTIFLILYRFLYYYAISAPADVANAGDLVRYLSSNYLLILRLLGQFDLIVGMMHLFGFHLPEANHLNFFATSFTDFWRRSNIYWKDFMLKVFYYPSYFQLRKLGATAGLVLATFAVFAVTAVLHAYQWFWILGSFQITLQDTLFWSIFGALMVGNVLWESRAGRKRAAKRTGTDWRELGVNALKAVGMFVFICVLWSLWTSSSLAEWFTLMSAITVMPVVSASEVVTAVVVSAGFLAVYTIAALDWDKVRVAGLGKNFYAGAMVTAAMLFVLYGLGNPLVQNHLGDRARATVQALEVDRLNQTDTNLLAQGYYENILGVSRVNSQLWEVYMQKPLSTDDNDPQASALRVKNTNDFLKEELRPNISVTFHNAPFHTNSWGMRDREYTQQKAPGTYRIAILGGSYVMGTGVGDNQTFENLVEDQLNKNDAGKPYGKYELLNFASGGYTILQDLMLLENKAFQFQPDAVFLIANPRDGDFAVHHLEERVKSGVEIPYVGLRDILAKAGVTKETDGPEADKRLSPYKRDIIAWTYRQMMADCQAHNVKCVWVYLTMPGSNAHETDALGMESLAQEDGFITLNLSGVYDGVPAESITLSSYDEHPNAEGHQLIADRLYQVLHQKEVWSALGLNSSQTQSLPTGSAQP